MLARGLLGVDASELELVKSLKGGLDKHISIRICSITGVIIPLCILFQVL